jgi:hypothetical protein
MKFKILNLHKTLIINIINIYEENTSLTIILLCVTKYVGMCK